MVEKNRAVVISVTFPVGDLPFHRGEHIVSVKARVFLQFFRNIKSLDPFDTGINQQASRMTVRLPLIGKETFKLLILHIGIKAQEMGFEGIKPISFLDEFIDMAARDSEGDFTEVNSSIICQKKFRVDHAILQLKGVDQLLTGLTNLGAFFSISGEGGAIME